MATTGMKIKHSKLVYVAAVLSSCVVDAAGGVRLPSVRQISARTV